MLSLWKMGKYLSMRTIFKVHPLTYFLLISVLFCGFFNYFLIISFILLMHDLGHIIVMKLNNIKINQIVILPFGSVINSSINSNIKSKTLFLINIAGVLMQVLLYLLFYFLYNFNIINDLSYNIFLFYNKLIIIFNLVPIIPLDGSKILISLIECLMPYKRALKVVNSFSLVFICIFLYLNKISLNLLLIITFLLYKTYIEILNHNFIFHKFLLDRYLNKFKCRKIKYIKNIKDIYKNKHNFINNESEEKVLNNLYLKQF